MKALRIDTNDQMIQTEIVGSTIIEQNDSIHAILGGQFDVVRIAADAVMLVDDEGLLKALPLNPMAMMISGYGSHVLHGETAQFRSAEHAPLVGVALIVGVMHTDDGEVFCDCPERYLRFADKIKAICRK